MTQNKIGDGIDSPATNGDEAAVKGVPPGVCWECGARDGEEHSNRCPLLRMLGASTLVFHEIPDDVYDKLHPPDGKHFCAIRKCMRFAADSSFYCALHDNEEERPK